MSGGQVALKNNVGVYYFQCSVPLHALLREDGAMERKPFLELWYEEMCASIVLCASLIAVGRGPGDKCPPIRSCNLTSSP